MCFVGKLAERLNEHVTFVVFWLTHIVVNWLIHIVGNWLTHIVGNWLTLIVGKPFGHYKINPQGSVRSTGVNVQYFEQTPTILRNSPSFNFWPYLCRFVYTTTSCAHLAQFAYQVTHHSDWPITEKQPTRDASRTRSLGCQFLFFTHFPRVPWQSMDVFVRFPDKRSLGVSVGCAGLGVIWDSVWVVRCNSVLNRSKLRKEKVFKVSTRATFFQLGAHVF